MEILIASFVIAAIGIIGIAEVFRKKLLRKYGYTDDLLPSPKSFTSNGSTTDTTALVKHLITEKLNAEEFAIPEMEEVGPQDDDIINIDPKRKLIL